MKLKITHFVEVDRMNIKELMKEYDFATLEDTLEELFTLEPIIDDIQASYEIDIQELHPTIVEEIKTLKELKE